MDDAGERMNSFHKIETLIDALVAFRDGMSAEAELRAPLGIGPLLARLTGEG